MSPVDQNAFLSLWKLDESPACDKGMELAKSFLVCAGEGVDRIGIEEPSDRLTELTSAYMALVEHAAGCDDCNEANELPERDDIPDLTAIDDEFVTDRAIGFQAAIEGKSFQDWQTEGWKRGWADAHK